MLNARHEHEHRSVTVKCLGVSACLFYFLLIQTSLNPESLLDRCLLDEFFHHKCGIIE